MKCLGRTKISKYRKRCEKDTKFLFCSQHYLQPFLVISAAIGILASLSAIFGINVKNIWENFKTLKPEISISMEYPLKIENDEVLGTQVNPEVLITNHGPVNAVSLSGDIKIYIYYKDQDKIILYYDPDQKGFHFFLSKKILEPFDTLRKSCFSFSGEGVIAIYVVHVVYYLESNKGPFNYNEYFLVENDSLIDKSTFQNDSRYLQII